MTAVAENTLLTVERLINTCREAREGFERAAEAAEDSSLKRLLKLYAHQRTRFAEELRQELNGSASAVAPARLDHVSPWSAECDADLLRECLRTDAQTLQLYQDALSARIPTRAHFLISAQYSLLQRVHERMQGLLTGFTQPALRPTVTIQRAAL